MTFTAIPWTREFFHNPASFSQSGASAGILDDSGLVVALIPGMNGPLVVLVAEDDVLVRNLINIVLTREGYSVLLAADGEEALELSRQYDGEIQLLLSDVMMPRMNGLELAASMLKERPATRALIISGKMSSEIVEGNAAFDFLRKPFLPLDLTRKIKAIFAQRGPGGIERI